MTLHCKKKQVKCSVIVLPGQQDPFKIRSPHAQAMELLGLPGSEGSEELLEEWYSMQVRFANRA